MALFNLMLVALLGTLMRYKIGFAFPYLNQKYILEAHYHFAFTGWISHLLYVLIINHLQENNVLRKSKIYFYVLWANLISAYGMLIAFFVQGYGSISISFSVLSVLTGFVFSFLALKDLQNLPGNSVGKNWIKAAIWFGMISTLGTGILADMMANSRFDQELYLGSIYFYLHFQYNGWFIFTCMGLFMHHIRMFDGIRELNKKIFIFFFLAGMPTFFLSTLWADLPDWLYALVVISSILQMFGWWYLVVLVKNNVENFKKQFTPVARVLLLVIGLAFSVKLFLQLGSTFPALSKLAFSFRPIVIAYLHLILLVIITGFLLFNLYVSGFIRTNRLAINSIIGFIAFAIINEIVLATQGIASFSYTLIPGVNKVLFFIATALLVSSMILFASQFGGTRKT